MLKRIARIMQIQRMDLGQMLHHAFAFDHPHLQGTIVHCQSGDEGWTWVQGLASILKRNERGSGMHA
ncbi:MAG TPA: hypothetical protein VGC19_12415 [Rhodanobacter sp.]